MLVDMFLHIRDNFVKEFVLSSFTGRLWNGGKRVVCTVVADQLYQKLLQIDMNQLFGAEGNRSVLTAD